MEGAYLLLVLVILLNAGIVYLLWVEQKSLKKKADTTDIEAIALNQIEIHNKLTELLTVKKDEIHPAAPEPVNVESLPPVTQPENNGNGNGDVHPSLEITKPWEELTKAERMRFINLGYKKDSYIAKFKELTKAG